MSKLLCPVCNQPLTFGEKTIAWHYFDLRERGGQVQVGEDFDEELEQKLDEMLFCGKDHEFDVKWDAEKGIMVGALRRC